MGMIRVPEIQTKENIALHLLDKLLNKIMWLCQQI